MPDVIILATDVAALLDLTELFCQNQKSFYSYIAYYAASDDSENDLKPLRFHKFENIVDCIFSRNIQWSFYNTILETDICAALKQHHRTNADRIIEQILSLASRYKCPMRLQVNPTAVDTHNLLKHHGFVEIPMRDDSYQYVDFDHTDVEVKHGAVSSDIEIYELDDSTQANCSTRKSEWGYVLCESFGFPNSGVYGTFYSNVWRTVEVGPTKPIRMFIAMKDDRVVGGCHVSLACGIACLFNVTTLKNSRGKGIGKALSFAAMQSAKTRGYRYMVLQGSDMGLNIYHKMGFKPIPSYRLFVKLSTAAWYFKIIEVPLAMIGIRRLQPLIHIIRQLSKHPFLIVMVVTIIIGLFIAIKFM